MDPKREDDNGDPASVRVLTDRALFAHITSFMDGLPFRIAMFAKAQRLCPRLTRRYPSSRGLLPQLAIIVDDMAMLEAIHRFSTERRRLRSEQSSRHQIDATLDAKQATMDRELEFHAVVRCAVRFDRLHILEWLRLRLPLDEYAFEHGLMDIAVTHSRGTAVMDWVLTHALGRAGEAGVGRQVSPWALRVVAYSGQLDKIRWLHEHGFHGFSPVVADAAASTGQLETLAFLHDQQIAQWTSRAMVLSATNGHLEVVRYLHENRGRDGTLAARASQGMTRAALHGHHEVVAFLGQCGYEPMWGTLQDVIAAGKVESLRALCLFTTEGCLFDARRCAKRYHHRAEMVELLNALIAPNVWFCNQRKHAPAGPRRCQRLHEQHADTCDGEGGAAAKTES
jgi:hypothetical protein